MKHLYYVNYKLKNKTMSKTNNFLFRNEVDIRKLLKTIEAHENVKVEMIMFVVYKGEVLTMES